MKYLNERMKQFVGKRGRFQRARKAGICAKQLVRMAGSPAAQYGVEVTGLAADHLHRARVAGHKATSAQAGGKNVDLAFHAADADGGQLDPAFMACIGPIKA